MYTYSHLRIYSLKHEMLPDNLECLGALSSLNSSQDPHLASFRPNLGALIIRLGPRVLGPIVL